MKSVFCAQIQTATLGGWWSASLWFGASFLGACLGSFGNVLVYRLPRNMSVVRPRSHCPGCNAAVAWYDITRDLPPPLRQ